MKLDYGSNNILLMWADDSEMSKIETSPDERFV